MKRNLRVSDLNVDLSGQDGSWVFRGMKITVPFSDGGEVEFTVLSERALLRDAEIRPVRPK